MNGRADFILRVRGILRKEMLQILRDPSSILLAIVMPLVMLFLFGYGVSLDAENVPVAIVMGDKGAAARELAARFSLSRYFEPRTATSMAAAEKALTLGKVDGIFHFQEGFSSDLATRHQARVQMIVNGIDANRARLILGYSRGLLEKWAAVRRARGEPVVVPAVVVSPRIWFNGAAESRNFLVPGLITLIMTLTGVLLTALVVAREWERGTMEALLATPIRVAEILLGKIVPYFVLGMGGLLLSVAMTIWLFDVPLRGSLVVLMGVSALFLLAALGMGLLISTLARNQFVAGQAAIIVTFLPAFMLSGFIFDIDSMPLIIQAVTYLIAARYYVAILQTVFAAGNVWSVIWPNALALAVMAAVFLLLVRRFSRRELD